MKSHPDLEVLREQIDDIDKALVCLLAQRFRLTHQVGQYKKMHHLNPVDEERERAQLNRVKALAAENGLSPEFAEKFLQCIIAEVVQNHKKRNQLQLRVFKFSQHEVILNSSG